MKNVVAADCGGGIGVGAAQGAGDEYNEFSGEIHDSIVHGENQDSLDCPPDGSFCKRFSKVGMTVSTGIRGVGVGLHPTMASGLANADMAKEGPWAYRAKMNNLKFKGFKA